MERADLPFDYNSFSKLDIVVTLISLTHVFNESKLTNRLFHIFRNDTIHLFMIPLETRRHN